MKSGYCGEQRIYLLSCSASAIYKSKTMVDLLQIELSKQLPFVNSIEVMSDASGETVFIVNESNEMETWVLKVTISELWSLRKYQSRFLSENAMKYQVTDTSQLLNMYLFAKEKVRAYKRDLIGGVLMIDKDSDDIEHSFLRNISFLMSFLPMFFISFLRLPHSFKLLELLICAVMVISLYFLYRITDLSVKLHNRLLFLLCHVTLNMSVMLFLCNLGFIGYIVGALLTIILFIQGIKGLLIDIF